MTHYYLTDKGRKATRPLHRGQKNELVFFFLSLSQRNDKVDISDKTTKGRIAHTTACLSIVHVYVCV